MNQYDRAIDLASELLYRVRIFGEGVPVTRADVSVSFRQIVSAICAVLQALEYPTEYRPYVFGDNTQTRSIITPLEKSIDFSGGTPREEIPEGYLHLWHNRREWVQHALEGSGEIAALMLKAQKALWAKAVECVSPNDIVTIERCLQRLESGLLDIGANDL